MENAAPQIAVITGPTATGKTALGVLVASALHGEIVSADAMQVYRRMDIGTAKVTQSEMQGIPHHMIDIAEPDEAFSVARYVREADACVQDILKRGALPIIVGGTGLYIDSLIAGRSFGEQAADPALRAELEKRYLELGGERLLSELRSFDPERADKLHPSDKKRVLRALEVYYTSGQTITEHDRQTQAAPARYTAKTLALSFENRADLYARIDKRVLSMVSAGLFEEVQGLISSGISAEGTAMQAIGYKEAALALSGFISREQAVAQIQRESRRYAKRQLTWLRRKENLAWILWNSDPDLEYARQFATKFFMAKA